MSKPKRTDLYPYMKPLNAPHIGGEQAKQPSQNYQITPIERGLKGQDRFIGRLSISLQTDHFESKCNFQVEN